MAERNDNRERQDPVIPGPLVEGIKKEAGDEAKSIRDEAMKSVSERKKAVQIQIEKITKEAEKKAKEQYESIMNLVEKTASAEKRRQSLQARNEIIEMIQLRAKERLKAMMNQTDEYRNVLESWIVEAAVGLDMKEASVNASAQEREIIDRPLLRRCEQQYQELAGKEIRLKKQVGDPLSAQGIILTSSDEKTAYNNQVHTRLLRYQSEILKIISEAVFEND